MLLEHLTLANMRNYVGLEFAPSAGLNVLVGDNAQGKSNLLEAIAMLGTGKSFRTAREGELVRDGQAIASVSGDARIAAGTIHLACSIAKSAGGTRKRYTLNGESLRYAAFLGRAKVVTFVPADLGLVAGGPSLRRAMLNAALSIAQPRYYRELARYRKVLMQKNALLRGAVAPDGDLLATYDGALVESGTALILARRHYVAALAEIAGAVQRRWVGAGEALEVRYAPSIVAETPTEAEIGAAFIARLAELRAAEAARRTALAGPHRDDLEVLVDGRAVGTYGSQGQQRTAVLALKVAEYTVLRERSGEAPILLLDDVLSELDQHRAGAFIAALGEVEQAFVTTTEQTPALSGAAAVFRVDAASVRPC